MDGDVDYSRYSRAELEEALARIDQSKYPRNYENLRRALEARTPVTQPENAPPSAFFLVACYTAAVLVLDALLNTVLDAALVVFFRDSADIGETVIRLKQLIFILLVVGANLHLARSYQSQFGNVAVGVALTLGVVNLLALRLTPFRGIVSPVAAFLGMLVLALLAAGIGRLLAGVFAPRHAPSNNRWRVP